MPTSFDCDICAEEFNDTVRLPKVLPCQHTFCLECLLHMDANGSITCPNDRKMFAVDVATALPNNLYVKGRIGNASSDSEMPSKRLKGTTDGDAEAVDKPQLQLLASLAKRREELLAALRAVRDAVLAALQDRVQVELKLVKRARDCMECLREDKQKQSSARAQELKREAASLLRAGATLDQDLQLLQPCLASVSAEGGWRSKRVQLSEQPALQLAALQLRQQDSLEWEPSQQEHQEGNSQQEPQAEQDTSCCSRMDLSVMSGALPGQLSKEKQDLLCGTDSLHMLTYLWCQQDPDFSPALMWKHAAHLEEVHLYAAGRTHLLALQSMPRLRRLRVHGVGDQTLGALPTQLPRGEGASGLTWLQLINVPRETAKSIIAANGHSLRKLRLGVGPPAKRRPLSPAGRQADPPATDPPAAKWFSSCDDLEDFLRDCRLQRLESLTLVRNKLCVIPKLCEVQLDETRRALPPDCRVRCTFCRVWVTGNF